MVSYISRKGFSRRGLMNTAEVNVLESIPKHSLRGLPLRIRKAPPTVRLKRIGERAGAFLEEPDSLDRDQVLADATAAPDNLDLESGINFFDEVRRFETRLIK